MWLRGQTLREVSTKEGIHVVQDDVSYAASGNVAAGIFGAFALSGKKRSTNLLTFALEGSPAPQVVPRPLSSRVPEACVRVRCQCGMKVGLDPVIL